ncbi:restriction endonuclease [Streptomyces sp. NPDC060187]|uniref:restriction endonuclease n=1 Tax=Streptomyces sp. NPDC060187 TaxID=3347067 RepID=UPI003663B844
MIETVPRLSKSKEGVITFLRSAGISETLLRPYRDQLAVDRTAVSKFKLVRSVLAQVNEEGDTALGVRRKLLQQVTDFQEYTTLWEEDRVKAKGLISDIRAVVEVKDAFTRMNNERDAERQERLARVKEQQKDTAQRRQRLEKLRHQLASLTRLQDPHARGIALEGLLNEVFSATGVLVRESFALRNDGGTVEEQIDGVIEVDGNLYIVEVKWWKKPIDIDPMCRQLVRVFNRAEARGLFISASGYTQPAVKECTQALTNRVVLLGEVRELMLLLEREGDVTNWVREKARLATMERRPLAIMGVDF